MHFINQAMKDKFDHCVEVNIDDVYGNSINEYVVHYADMMEDGFFRSDQPLEEWLFDNARDLEYAADIYGLTGFQVEYAKQVLEDVWIFGKWLSPALEAKEQEVEERWRKERESYLKNQS